MPRSAAGLMVPQYVGERRVSWAHAKRVSDPQRSQIQALGALFWVADTGAQQWVALYRSAAAAGLV